MDSEVFDREASDIPRTFLEQCDSRGLLNQPLSSEDLETIAREFFHVLLKGSVPPACFTGDLEPGERVRLIQQLMSNVTQGLHAPETATNSDVDTFTRSVAYFSATDITPRSTVVQTISEEKMQRAIQEAAQKISYRMEEPDNELFFRPYFSALLRLGEAIALRAAPKSRTSQRDFNKDVNAAISGVEAALRDLGKDFLDNASKTRIHIAVLAAVERLRRNAIAQNQCRTDASVATAQAEMRTSAGSTMEPPKPGA